MTIGQIVYDIEGVDGSKTSSSNENINTIINSKTNQNYENEKVKISEDLVEKIGTGKLAKIGIQAPYGTVAKINGKSIRIGRTETYELDDSDISIRSLSFENTDTIKNLFIDYTKEEGGNQG